MAVSDLIHELQSTKKPSRETDAKIALLFGWQRQVATSEGATKSRKVSWIHPVSGENRLPAFTFSVDAALELLDLVARKSHGGVSWVVNEAGVTCTVKVDEGPYYHAATPALSICVAALNLKAADLGDF
ncbi:hypothetical protein KXS15_27140 [Sinorhizobium meliloti]|uniref:hypothetical protein n=1 Tax=Rhizobium meliloti TaxID=382 RepID=UPI003F16B572